MLLTKTIMMQWNPSNKKWYESKGYSYTNMGDEFEIKIEDISLNSIKVVKVQCDICGKVLNRKYQEYRTRRESSEYKIYSCAECRTEKIKINTIYKYENNIMNKDDIGYFQIEDNILKELKLYIEKYKVLDNMNANDDGRKLYNAITRSNNNTSYYINLLGYNVDDLYDFRLPNGYYKDFEKLKDKIESLMKTLNRFPTEIEISKELKIYGRTLDYFGGMNGIKKLMNYNKANDLQDDLGYYNSSNGEYIISQWLISQGIVYKRNVQIDNDSKHNCDWVTQPLNDKSDKIWIEYWGGLNHKSNSNSRNIQYRNTHDIKIKKYQENNCKLISIYPNDFDGLSYDEKQNFLYNIFKDYIKIPYTKIDDKKIYALKLTDEEIIESLYNGRNEIPSSKFVYKNNRELFDEIISRHGSYSSFYEKYNLNNKFQKNGYWTKERIFKYFDHMINKYDKILGREEIKQYVNEDIDLNNFNKIYSVINKYGGFYNLKIEYLKLYVLECKKIHNDDVTWLMLIGNKKPSNKITEENINDSNYILKLIKKDYNEYEWLKLKYETKLWSFEKIYSVFDNMINDYGKIISKEDSEGINKQFYMYLANSGLSLITIKLYYLKNCIRTNKIIPSDEIKWLDSVCNLTGKIGRIKNKITQTQKQLAKEILEKYNNKPNSNISNVNNVQVYNTDQTKIASTM